MKTVLQKEKVCAAPFCKATSGLEDHHIFFGTSNRKQSEKYGLKVWLCKEHHTGQNGVHHKRELDLYFKRLAQKYFEKHIGSREEFREIFGKSWL